MIRMPFLGGLVFWNVTQTSWNEVWHIENIAECSTFSHCSTLQSLCLLLYLLNAAATTVQVPPPHYLQI